MEKYVVTITRQFGSMGRPIAKMVAEKLNIPYYDRDIVEATAKRLNMPVSFVSNEEETAKSPFLRMKFPLGKAIFRIKFLMYKEILFMILQVRKHVLL